MNESVTQLRDTTGNPAPLGLLGFGMTTVLLNLHNAGFYELNSMILAMGICYGGAAQIFAGIMEWRKGNTFATTAFLSYGLFLFFLLAIGDFINAGPDFRHFTGYEGIFCGLSAIYAGLAQVLNEVFGKIVLPLGPVDK